MSQLVVCGPTRFHELDEEATRLAGDSEFRRHLDTLQDTWGTWGDPEKLEARYEASARLKEMLGRTDAHDYDILKIRWKISDWRPGLGLPVCAMINVGRILPIEEAVRIGLVWSKECAARQGIIGPDVSQKNPLESWARVPATGRYRAYKHVLDCDVCWNHGIGKCELFVKIATLEIDSDLDPRQDPEHVG